MKNGMMAVIILILLVVIGIGCYAFFFPRKAVSYQSLKSMHFSYSTGTAYLANVFYEIDCESGSCMATIKLEGVEEEDAKKVSLTDDDIQKVLDILNRYEVSNWDGFHKVDSNVLDGNSFSFWLHSDEKDISASGYMCYPENYREVRGELDSFFESFCKEE